MARILVVDDDADVARLFALALGCRGRHEASVTSGVAALQAMEREEFSVVISDIDMPGMTGWELLENVRRLHENTAVILVTGNAGEGDEKRAIEEGAFAFLPKPVAIGTLAGTVCRALASRSVARESPTVVSR